MKVVGREMEKKKKKKRKIGERDLSLLLVLLESPAIETPHFFISLI